MRTDLKPWGQPGDEARKARYDSGGKRMGETGIDTSGTNFGEVIRNLAAEMPEMTPAQRRMTMIIIGVLAVSFVTASCSGMPVEGGNGYTNTPDTGETGSTPVWTQLPVEQATLTPYVPTPTRIEAIATSTTTVESIPTQTPIPTLVATATETEVAGNASRELVWGDLDFGGVSRVTMEEKVHLASRINCPEGVCVNDGMVRNLPEYDRDVIGISTGEVTTIKFNDIASGKEIGFVDVAEFVSKSPSGEAFSFWSVIQSRSVDNPNINIRYEYTNYLLDDWSRPAGSVIGLDELGRLFGENRIVLFGYSSNRCPPGMNPTELAICQQMYATDHYVNNLDRLYQGEVVNNLLIFPILVEAGIEVDR